MSLVAKKTPEGMQYPGTTKEAGMATGSLLHNLNNIVNGS
jgi:hypothetical protein